MQHLTKCTGRRKKQTNWIRCTSRTLPRYWSPFEGGTSTRGKAPSGAQPRRGAPTIRGTFWLIAPNVSVGEGLLSAGQQGSTNEVPSTPPQECTFDFCRVDVIAFGMEGVRLMVAFDQDEGNPIFCGWLEDGATSWVDWSVLVLFGFDGVYTAISLSCWIVCRFDYSTRSWDFVVAI